MCLTCQTEYFRHTMIQGRKWRERYLCNFLDTDQAEPVTDKSVKCSLNHTRPVHHLSLQNFLVVTSHSIAGIRRDTASSNPLTTEDSLMSETGKQVRFVPCWFHYPSWQSPSEGNLGKMTRRLPSLDKNVSQSREVTQILQLCVSMHACRVLPTALGVE